jgi:hypothetical protein
MTPRHSRTPASWMPLGDGFFLPFFISARSSIECQSEAHHEARLELDRFAWRTLLQPAESATQVRASGARAVTA